jgi:hypothetical protein
MLASPPPVATKHQHGAHPLHHTMQETAHPPGVATTMHQLQDQAVHPRPTILRLLQERMPRLHQVLWTDQHRDHMAILGRRVRRRRPPLGLDMRRRRDFRPRRLEREAGRTMGQGMSRWFCRGEETGSEIRTLVSLVIIDVLFKIVILKRELMAPRAQAKARSKTLHGFEVA